MKKHLFIIITIVTLALFTVSTYAQSLTLAQKTFINQHHESAIQLGAKYGIPWQTAMAQAIVESTHGTSYMAIKHNNLHGIGFKRTVHYESTEAGWKGYYQLVANDPVYVSQGSLRYPDDPYGFLQCITYAGYNPYHEKYIRDISGYVTAVEQYRVKRGWPTSSEYQESREQKTNKTKLQLTNPSNPHNPSTASPTNPRTTTNSICAGVARVLGL